MTPRRDRLTLHTHKNHQLPDWMAQASKMKDHLTPARPLMTAALDVTPGPFLPHFHNGMEVFILVKGGMEIECGDTRQTLEPGDVWLIPSGEPHSWRNIEKGHIVFFLFYPGVLEMEIPLELSLFNMFTTPPEQRPRCTTPELRSLALSVAHEVICECKEPRPERMAVCRLHLLRLLIALRREWKPPRYRKIRVNAASFDRLQPAITLAGERPPRKVPPSEAAAACNLSLARFHQIFTQTMGLSYGNFGRRSRLAYAARLLLDTELPIATIARETAFSDGSHFYYRFVERYRIPPSEYRKLVGSLKQPTN